MTEIEAKIPSEPSSEYFHSRNQYLATITANGVALSYGFILGWTSPALPILASLNSPLATGPLTNDQISWIGSINFVNIILSKASVVHYVHCLLDFLIATEKIREETCPANPFIVFSAKPTVQVVLENPVPRTGLFTINSNISNGDTTQSFTNKIAKIVGLKDVDALRIWRFEDAVLGPRKLPIYTEPFKGKVQMEDGEFSIDVEKSEVTLQTESSKINVGTSFIYVVE